MTARALRKMARQRGIELRDGHRSGKKIGVVEKVWVEDGRLHVRGKLTEPMSEGTACGMSVGGTVKEAFWGWDTQSGDLVRYLDDVELEHVAVCAPEAAVNPETWLKVMWRKVRGALGAGRRGNDEKGVRRAAQVPPPLEGESIISPDGTSLLPQDETEGLTEEERLNARRRDEDKAVTAEEGEGVVRRGEPQGLGGQEVRHVSAARLWEGVL